MMCSRCWSRPARIQIQQPQRGKTRAEPGRGEPKAARAERKKGNGKGRKKVMLMRCCWCCHSMSFESFQKIVSQPSPSTLYSTSNPSTHPLSTLPSHSPAFFHSISPAQHAVLKNSPQCKPRRTAPIAIHSDFFPGARNTSFQIIRFQTINHIIIPEELCRRR